MTCRMHLLNQNGPTRKNRMEPLLLDTFLGRLLLTLCLRRFPHANRYPLRSKTLPPHAETREGSSTMEKRTPALWRFSSETSRQQSSASLRDLNGPLTWAEPSTSLWKFIEPNSPPITDRKSTRLNSSHVEIAYAVFCLKKKIERDDHPFRSSTSHTAQ